MLSTLPSFKKYCVDVPVSITSTKLVFWGTISRVVLTLNLLGLTILYIDAPPPQFAGPGEQGFGPDTHMCYDPPMRLSKVAVYWWSVCWLSHVPLPCSMFVVTPCVHQYYSFIPIFFPRRLPPCRAILRCALLVLVGIRWLIIAAIKAVIWAVWASAAAEKVLASSEISNVAVVVSEGGPETSSDMMPWKFEEKPEDPVVADVSRPYLSDLYMKTVNSTHEDLDVCSAQSRSAMSNIPDFRIFSIAIRRIVFS